MEKKNTSKPVYLYICDSERRIADNKCSGTGCLFFGECQHTLDVNYAKNSEDERWFEYFCSYDSDDNIEKEFYWEIEKRN